MFLTAFFVHKRNKFWLQDFFSNISPPQKINQFSKLFFPIKLNNFYLINSFYDGSIEVVSFSEERVERDLADLRPHGRLGKLGDGELRVLDSVAGLVRILNPKVQHAINVQGHVVWKKTKCFNSVFSC